MTEVSYTKLNMKAYRLTFDGRVLGDSRGYDTAEDAQNAALALVQNDHEQAFADCRECRYVYRPCRDWLYA